MWIDTHCHPFAAAFDGDRDAMLARARAAGVEKMIVVGFDPATNRQALDFAEQNADMWATVGVHPCDAAALTDEELAWMEETARTHPRVVGIGETGLDYYHMSFPKELQAEAFRKQVRLAKAVNKPVIVHSRDAAEDTLQVLVDEGAEKVIFHCFSYDLPFARKVWERGYYTSFSGVITYPSAGALREVVKAAPAELILIETDCPYLAPQSVRGQRNEIAYVAEVGKKVAELRGEGAVLSNELFQPFFL